MLRLMQALMTPSLRDLIIIAFAEASVRFSDDSGAEQVITARQSKAMLVLQVSGVPEELAIPLAILESLEEELPPSRRPQESIRALRLKYADSPVFQRISELNSPVFLGLDRRQSGFQEDVPRSQHYYGEPNFLLRSEGRSSPSYPSSLGAGLIESQKLVHRAYSRVRRVKDMQAERLKKNLLLTGFEYSTFDSEGFNVHATLSSDELREQRQQLTSALLSLGFDPSDLKKEVDPFFNRIIALSERLEARSKNEPADHEAMFEAVLNRASVLRLRRLVSVVKDSNEKVAKLSNRFSDFVRCVNFFFKDSRKEIEVDGVGVLKVLRPDRTNVPVEALSSGERQLLIMFAHLFFNAFGDRSSVFIIDEPELSLHLKWQEALLEKMQESSPRAQIIVATHSPEIVGEYRDNCIGVA